jgi:hypothetical protein
MDSYEGPHTALTIALYRDLYLAILMVIYEGPNISLTLAVHEDLYLAIVVWAMWGPSQRSIIMEE